ncbi:MAG: amino acid permease [Gammaproteobacteria bacterium]|nr:amino acid permease [Gammaproteobacteria bacterium]
MSQKLKMGSIVAMTLISVANIRNLPNLAHDGPVFIWVLFLSALFFLVPVVLATAHLSSKHDQSGGVYVWVKAVFSKKWAFLAAWLQWIENVFYYPVLLIFIAKNFFIVILPDMVNHEYWISGVIPFIFGLMTYINTKGVFVSARLSRICAYLGLLIPGALMILTSGYWLGMGHASIEHLNFFDFSKTDLSQALITSIVMFCGIEIATVHAGEVEDAKNTYPRALLLSSLMIFLLMMLGSLSLLLVVGQSDLNGITGLVIYFQKVLGPSAAVLVMLMALAGQIGALNNWIISPVRALQSAFLDAGVAQRWIKFSDPEGSLKKLLWSQAALVLLFCLLYFQIKAEQVYYVFNMLLVLLYMPMYVIVLLAMVYDDSGPSLVFGRFDCACLRWTLAGMGISSALSVFVFTLLSKPNVFAQQTYFEYLCLVMLPWLFCLMVPSILARFRD